MTLPLYLAEPGEVAAAQVGDILWLRGPEGRHAAAVARHRPGERVLVGDGNGTVATCVVTEVAGREALAAQVAEIRGYPVRKPSLTVVQALPKGDRGELAVELLTEVGVDRIVPWQAARCVTRWNPQRAGRGQARWQAVASAATKQSRRPTIPLVTAMMSTRDLLGLVGGAGRRALVAHESAARQLWQALGDPCDEVILIVGPEGGISDEELVMLAAAGAEPVVMGPGVLRTSSAGAIGAALISVTTGRW